jgi:multidrug resistance efflux pump
MCAALLLLAAFVYLGASFPLTLDVSAQETASDVSQTRMRAIQGKIQLAEIRLAIRLQEVEVAKAERRLVATVAGRAAEMMEVQQKLAKTTNELTRLTKLKEEGLVSEERIKTAEAARRAAESEVAVRRANSTANSDKLAVCDEKIKVLVLRSELAKARLDQLKRRLN